METILSPFSASISELKKNPTALLKEAEGSPIAILNHNRLVTTQLPEVRRTCYMQLYGNIT